MTHAGHGTTGKGTTGSAAVAAASVAEPLLCSLGGGGFLLAHPADRVPVLYDFFAQTPGRARDGADFRAVEVDFGPATQEFHVGLGAAAVPGAIRGIAAVHADLASRPLSALVAPAAELARAGVPLRDFDAYAGRILAPILATTPEIAGVFQDPAGTPRAPGERPVQPQLAETLDRLGVEGDRPFHEGDLAQALGELSRAAGGHLSADDLARYRVERRQPLARGYRDARLLTNPAPSSGGMLVAFALDLLQAAGPAGSAGSAAQTGALARAMRLTSDARGEAERLSARETPERALFDPGLLARYRAAMAGRPRCGRGTTHISVADAAGNLAAVTLSNGEGCGHAWPGTGIHLNNMLGEEDLHPDGFDAWPTDTRIASMMAPSVLELGCGRQVAFGSGGSNRIRTALVQVASLLVDYGLSAAEAVAAARLHVDRGLVSIEPGFTEPAIAAAAAEGQALKRWPERNMFFGGVHAVERLPDGRVTGAGDPRRGGTAAVLA
ncbi:gamma-glutamyltransferase [Rhodovibrio sodomensis]|nr:gamma-glutamyltransferase [Rhodovibrio sodomensis]